MNLVNLDLGKWIYLIIYLFFPVLSIIYLIRSFGLEVKEDSLTTARKYMEQADYWADVALQAVQSPVKSKNLASLEHTIQHNLDHALKYLAKADSDPDEVKSLKQEYGRINQKLHRIQRLNTASLPISVSPSRQ